MRALPRTDARHGRAESMWCVTDVLLAAWTWSKLVYMVNVLSCVSHFPMEAAEQSLLLSQYTNAAQQAYAITQGCASHDNPQDNETRERALFIVVQAMCLDGKYVDMVVAINTHAAPCRQASGSVGVCHSDLRNLKTNASTPAGPVVFDERQLLRSAGPLAFQLQPH